MVDELRVWPHARHRCFRNGSAHLTVSEPSELPALHAFAARLGLKRAWFQDHPIAPHYDLSPAKHELALKLGAVLVSARDQARERVRRRAALATPIPVTCDGCKAIVDYDPGIARAVREVGGQVRCEDCGPPPEVTP